MYSEQKQIRNFCIISHIDHGKSTLADRFLELTQTIEKRKMREQFLDMMELEREKGITIKLQPVRMEYQEYILNLIDTPGHVDFSYEVSRSLAAVEGAILLVDASQGVQAQTLANLHLAQEQDLIIIPVINKIDLPQVRIEETEKEMTQIIEGLNRKDILRISAKQGTNIERVLERIIKKLPDPKGDLEKPLRALIFDSSYDPYKGVVAYVRIVDGRVKPNDKIKMIASGAVSEAVEVGVFRPQAVKIDLLQAGEIGYIATGLKSIEQCRVGDTITQDQSGRIKSTVKSLVGYKEARPVVFASLYPSELEDHDNLKENLAKLKLNDAALIYEPESSEGLGRGFRCGFLGMLHLEIILERLRREYNLNLVITSPSVSYQITTKDKQSVLISSADKLPDLNKIERMTEPWVRLEIITPSDYLGPIMKLLERIRSQYKDTQYLSSQRVLLKYEAPLNEIIVDFYDKLKNITAGYASMNYELENYRESELVKIDILVAGEKAKAFSKIVHKSRAEQEARATVKKLKKYIPSQLFAVPVQAAISGKIIARETIKALRKDVTGYLYGGDYSRKKKLLEKQKKGKKKMKALGKVNIPQEVFFKVLKK